MTAAIAPALPAAEHRAAHFRNGVVSLIILALLVFKIAAPDADWARAISVVLTGGALTVAIATSRAPGPVCRRRASVAGGVALVVAVGAATGRFSPAITFAALTLFVAVIPITLVSGLLRLIREEGVTGQAVAAGLAIYLLAGLLFASVIALVAHVQSGPYLTQGAHVPNNVRVYYSFTVLTSTGFGDYTAATGVGHALAVLEMLTGQLYLVTVLGVLIGHYAGGRR